MREISQDYFDRLELLNHNGLVGTGLRKALLRSPQGSALIAYLDGKPNPQAESLIQQNAQASFFYASLVLNLPFDEADVWGREVWGRTQDPYLGKDLGS
jgi:hypothetical protein